MEEGTEFLILFFDAYSVEQSYVTHIMEKTLPFPYNDRGYTFKVLLNVVEKREDVQYEASHYNGFVKLDNTEHLVKYFQNLHLHGELSSLESINHLLTHFDCYKNQDEEYRIPAGVNVILGRKINS